MKLIFYFLVLAAYVGSSLALKNEVCGLPHNSESNGGCLAHFEKWSYNTVTKECALFIYGGCGGNANRFSSRKDCEDKCLE
ncbi:uncharacterized protein Dvir_GJ26426 [Drosophila virilis]|uniref:BPTI/Kunitz inhibitor domain-containing protein n=1 Tax=Drosophila virilis TaxID=7244 RepID=A0A0Q9WN58_DROVI|nr:male accessory gland serine protease inhibitor [Drosophila virilis]KRF81792.1 uncharacterized protein Dvir_GJ26426 [Drosophila virilis]